MAEAAETLPSSGTIRPNCGLESGEVELTRFRGQIQIWVEGVHDAEESRALSGGVSAADG